MPTTEQLNGYVERFYKEVMNGKKGNLFTRVEWLEENLKRLQVGDITQFITNVIQENKEIIQPSILGGVSDPTDATFSGIVISPSGQMIDGILYSFAIVIDGVVFTGFGDDGGTPVVIGTGGDMTKAVYDPTLNEKPAYVWVSGTEPSYHFNGLIWLDTGITLPTPDPIPEVVAEITNYGGNGNIAAAVVTYYVSTSGSDSNDGLSTSTPWQTLAKVNALSMTAGTYVLFKRGDTWSSTTSLVVPASGTATHYNYFGAYGTGANPIITRSDSNYGIKTNGKSYLMFQYIDSTTGTRNYYVYDSTYVIIRDCDVVAAVADEGCIVIEGSGATTSHNISIVDVTSTGQPGWMVSIGSGINVQQDKIEIRGCTILDIAAGGAVQHHGIYVKNCTDLDINMCTITNPDHGAIKIVQNSGKTVSGRIRRCDLSEYGTVGGSGAGISLDGVDGQLIIDSNLIHDGLYNAGIWCLSASSNIEVYSNTIVRNYYGIEMLDGSAGWIIKNNLIVQDMAWINSTSRSCIKMETEADIANNTYDNNLYWHKNGAGSENPLRKDSGGAISLATWQALGSSPDPNSLSVDPELVTPYTNLHLQATSDAIAAGDAVVGVTIDYDGVTLADPPDIGAYQYVAP